MCDKSNNNSEWPFQNNSDHVRHVYSFSRIDHNSSMDRASIQVELSEHASWFEVLNEFLRFLQGCGYFIDSDHPIRNLEDLHEEWVCSRFKPKCECNSQKDEENGDSVPCC